ncbi:type IV toxin-antitoxin system AbiEi family antitoxin domain-containing protein [Nocardia miyunensis]|uniref:type IV toxin-antitoxin system AbiEi family antitoxin domain-containing protein n=1 Tax=Nocardia miyunensis TaxID=282684 RepID=UPI00082AF40F|nr:type IV toxin-antitoxin system AbiEi family antitoxin domain-containing protein [Nocardia miyunensis]
MGTPQPISRRDALAAGLSDSDLRRLCRHGLWHRVRTGHYLDAPAEMLSAVDRHRALIRATIAATADVAVVSHVSALIGHDLPTWRIRLDRVHLTRTRRNGARIGRLLVVHAGQLAADDVVAVEGIRYTTAARTIVDIARTEEFEQAVAAGDAALHRGATSAAQLREQLHRARARPGYKQAAQVLTFLDGRSSGVGESRLRVAMAAARLPAPEVKARILSPDNSFVARVDCLFPELGVAADFDPSPETSHDPDRTEAAGRAAFATELREDRLRALGWIPVRWTWDELDDPEEIERRITAAAEAAASLTRRGRWVPAPRLR